MTEALNALSTEWDKSLDNSTQLASLQKELDDAKKVKMFVFHTCRENDAKLLMEKIKNVNPKFDDIDVYMVTPAVGAHIGPGILGFGYYILEK